MSLVIVGAGPAGLLAAIAASEKSNNILLFNKNPNPGKKIAAVPFEDFFFSEKLPATKMAASFGEKADFVIPIFKSFGYPDLVKMFKKFDLNLEADSQGHFRANGLAGDALGQALKAEVIRQGVKLNKSCRVTDIASDGDRITGVIANNSLFPASKVILATGSFSSPKFGATRDGYEISRRLGHRITELKPALVDLLTEEKYGKFLGGMSIDDVMIGVYLNNKEVYSEIGLIKFTENGISGPVVLNQSANIIDMLRLGRVEVRLDFAPDKPRKRFESWLIKHFSIDKHIPVGEFLNHYFCNDIIKAIEIESHIKLENYVSHITNLERKSLIHAIKDFRLTIKAHKPFNNTRGVLGGVSTDDIDPRTMQSKKVKRLFFAGDLIDVLGPYGGFNMQFAFSSGYLAGKSAASLS
jgi:predicted Rossmann fold flavoprotein